MTSNPNNFDTPGFHAVTRAEGGDGSIASITGLVERLAQFASYSDYVQGITLKSNAEKDNTAFIGGHTATHRNDHATMSVYWDGDKPVRSLSTLTVPDERLAEIANGYTLPAHLRNPDNYADAFIGTIIKGLVGYEENLDKPFQEQADESTDSIIATPERTFNQRIVASSSGQVNLSQAQMNVLYRPEQIEMTEHVLRFLIACSLKKRSGERSIHGGIEYDTATGMLADMLTIVNGANGFNKHPDPANSDAIYRGVLPQKTSFTVEDGVVYKSEYGQLEPMWPPDVAETYQVEKIAEAERIREESKRYYAELDAAREAKQVARRAGESHQLDQIEGTMGVLADTGFTWRGIVVVGGQFDTVEKVKEYYTEKYTVPADHIHVIEDAAIYGGKQVNLSPGSMTVYVRETPNDDGSIAPES